MRLEYILFIENNKKAAAYEIRYSSELVVPFDGATRSSIPQNKKL